MSDDTKQETKETETSRDLTGGAQLHVTNSPVRNDQPKKQTR
jgi:hypothetical protein